MDYPSGTNIITRICLRGKKDEGRKRMPEAEVKVMYFEGREKNYKLRNAGAS